MRARPSAAVVLGLVLVSAAALGAPSGGCGPVVAPSEPPEVGDAGDAATVDICKRPDAPAECEAGKPEPPDASTTSCRNGKADGFCELSEACTCVDCAALGRCTGRCVDDGVCRRGGGAAGSAGSGGASGSAGSGSGGAAGDGLSGSSGQSGAGQAGASDGLDEDCSCNDCDGKVAGCVPTPIGCRDNGVCSALEDDCTCADCRDDRDCEACVDNGYCARYTESCACADCASLPECQADVGP